MTSHTAPMPLTCILTSQRGAVGETWWGRKFLELMVHSNDYIRLNSGKSYARNGQVQWMEASPCSVEAKVSGSYIYAVRIRFTPLSEKSWNQLFEVIADEASFAARLMAGSVPEGMERRLSKKGLSLFPKVEPKSKGCNCPDRGNPCKHEAAIFFLLTENIDKDPFLLFLLLGKTREEVLAGLRNARTADQDISVDKGNVKPDPVQSCSYYRIAGDIHGPLANLPDIQVPDEAFLSTYLQKQLGKCPISLGDAGLGTILAELYPRAATVATRWVRQMGTNPNDPGSGDERDHGDDPDSG
ncbi:MAG: hypothetical protein LUQ50_07155 [Methanospirillum sp.]|uniref:SWIM zinc finger family protein n=1 Tax=Methanospirillum sp. TaxID=45200 RepID=UPI002376271A|nr:hypothetical protein [Methanospirillum sp.]MDD1728830.1 hypothetical protein [Methanospirillum sp.]